MCRKPYLSDTYQQAQQALLDGTCAFYAQGDWVVGELEKIDADKTASSIGAFSSRWQIICTAVSA